MTTQPFERKAILEKQKELKSRIARDTAELRKLNDGRVITVRLIESHHTELKLRARKAGKSLNQFCIDLLSTESSSEPKEKAHSKVDGGKPKASIKGPQRHHGEPADAQHGGGA